MSLAPSTQPGRTVAPPPPDSSPAGRRPDTPLWLAIHLPQLPLQAHAPLRHPVQPGPRAVYAAADPRQRLLCCNAAARAAGLHPGQSLSAAHSLCSTLQVWPRDPAAEQAALEALAGWASQFSPRLHLRSAAPSGRDDAGNQGLRLEIGASLTLFGGLEALLGLVREGLDALAYTARLGLAPTPLGAWWLARAGIARPHHGRLELSTSLRRLPLAVLERSPLILDGLRAMGVTRLGDLLRLPRDGLRRRFGPELLLQLDRALGQVSDPQPNWQPASHHQRRLSLPGEIDDAGQLAFAARRLLLELAGLLRARDAAITEFELRLHSRSGPPLSLPIGLLRPSRDPEHLLSLLRERLDRQCLSAPVAAISLISGPWVPQSAADATLTRPLWPAAAPDPLPPAAAGGTAAWQTLVERLQARLGEGTVRGLQPWPEHRPERAWCPTRPDHPAPRHPAPALACGPRPTWLLEPARPLAQRHGQPWLEGPLQLLRGPERIESGWWDGGEIARDYYLASDPGGARYWIYRECHGPRGWFLHGLFG